DVLEAVETARGKFSMIELGGGCGRWSIRGYLAARQRGIKQVRVVAVEPEPNHATWLRDCFQLNCMDGESFQIREAAVSMPQSLVIWLCSHPGMPAISSIRAPGMANILCRRIVR